MALVALVVCVAKRFATTTVKTCTEIGTIVASAATTVLMSTFAFTATARKAMERKKKKNVAVALVARPVRRSVAGCAVRLGKAAWVGNARAVPVRAPAAVVTAMGCARLAAARVLAVAGGEGVSLVEQGKAAWVGNAHAVLVRVPVAAVMGAGTVRLGIPMVPVAVEGWRV